jgi:hypothetical protein
VLQPLARGEGIGEKTAAPLEEVEEPLQKRGVVLHADGFEEPVDGIGRLGLTMDQVEDGHVRLADEER